MRRALGLQEQPPSIPQRETLSPSSIGAFHPHRRHFIRDGEVPVTVVHHDDGDGTNKLDAARQALREQIAAREQAERGLDEARATIQTLETQLAYERIAREEALKRADDERQQFERPLEDERAARRKAEQGRDEANAARQEAEGRLRRSMDTQEARKAGKAPGTPQPRNGVEATIGRSDGNELETPNVVPAARSADDTTTVKQGRRRGRPPKVQQTESEVVEWWVPGWKDRFR